MWTVQEWYSQAHAAAAGYPTFYRKMAEIWLNNIVTSTGMSREETGQKLVQSSWERLDAAPSTIRYPELRGLRELVAAQWRGWREGAGLTEAQGAAFSCGFFYYQRYATALTKHAAHCSYVYFPESDHGPLLANNLDSTPAEPFAPPPWPLLNEHLIAGSVSSGVFLDEQSPEIFPAPVFQLLARYARSTDEGVDLLTHYNHFWGPCNTLLVDRQRNLAMIEKSACRIAVRRSPDGFGFITAMTAEEPAFAAYLQGRQQASLVARGLKAPCADTAYWAKQNARRKLMTELVDEARRNPTLEGFRRIIQFRCPQRGNVCGNGEVCIEGGPPSEYTLKTSIWLLGKGRAQWWAREGDKPSYENRMPDIDFKDVLLW